VRWSFRAGIVVLEGGVFVDFASGSAAASHGSLAALSLSFRVWWWCCWAIEVVVPM
jgi:hypothetical protein